LTVSTSRHVQPSAPSGAPSAHWPACGVEYLPNAEGAQAKDAMPT
jgi:hypothetical protein